jgi:hypothetical protein
MVVQRVWNHVAMTRRGDEPVTGKGSPVARREILPLLAGYWSFGQYWGSWVILVYDFLRGHGLSQSGIGLLYMSLSIFSIITMLLVAPRLQPFAPNTNVPLSLAVLGVGTFVIAYAPGSALVAGFIVVGVGNGLVDVFMNVAAQRVEVRSGRPVLQWLHAAYALGGVTGALGAGLLRAAGGDYRIGIAATGVVMFGVAAWNARTASRERTRADRASLLSVSALKRSPMLIVPAFIVLSAFLVEGSMDTWSGLFVRSQLGASVLATAVAFAAFATAMLLGRLFAGRVLFGLGYRRTILVSGVGAAIGGLGATLTDSAVVAGISFLVLGFTLSAAAPAAFGLVAGSEEDPTNAIAAITTVGYAGFVFSPPLLGWVADTFSLRATMAVIVFATLGIVIGGLLSHDRGAGP